MAAREEAKKIKAAEDAANAKKAMQKVKHTQASIGMSCAKKNICVAKKWNTATYYMY